MNDLQLALRQVAYENRTFWRNPPAVFFTIALPLMFLVILNLLFGDDQIDRFGTQVSGSVFYVPGIAALAVISASYTNIAMMVSIARDRGVASRGNWQRHPLPGSGASNGRLRVLGLCGGVAAGD